MDSMNTSAIVSALRVIYDFMRRYRIMMALVKWQRSGVVSLTASESSLFSVLLIVSQLDFRIYYGSNLKEIAI